MTDREKVMRGLECCCTHIVGMSCGNCPYEIEQREDEGISDCTSVLAYDALALLKEQINCENCAMAIEDRKIVHCKNCKHGELKRYGAGEKYACIKSEYEGCFFFHDGDWFCADGEKLE